LLDQACSSNLAGTNLPLPRLPWGAENQDTFTALHVLDPQAAQFPQRMP